MNRLLLHGARYHDRKAVFVSPDLGETPDWRADRRSIRIALALREELGVGPGDLVALSMPLCVQWALAERAVWGLGAATLPLTPGRSPGRRVKAVLASRSDCDALLDRGGTLDTPERATAFRAAARDVSPDEVASIEPDGPLRQREWVERIERFLVRFPPARGGSNVLAMREPHVSARALVYAGWADGLTTVVLDSEDRDGGSAARRFANLADLNGGIDG
jgi:acyl-coenzyme A synthetase/AMP-(fatty) acid ligase